MLDMNSSLSDVASDTAADNGTAEVRLEAPQTGRRWSIGGIAWSYAGIAADTAPGFFQPLLDTSAGIYIHALVSGDTSGGAALVVARASTTRVFGIEVVTVGHGHIEFAEPIKFAPNNSIVIQSRDGGGSHTISVLGAKIV